ncbi:MAG: SDR family NAD(P)-dependent oxidoreductase [Candidatus Bathyarchaeia archaeon]
MTQSIPATKWALITGASSGIGYELSKVFAREGYNLILVSRNEEALQKLATQLRTEHEVLARVIAKDLAAPNSTQEIYSQLQKESIAVNVLVNCAGLGVAGKFSETDLSTELRMIQVNIVALTELTKLFLKDMVRRREGRILNVASTAAFQPGPLMAVYYATKAYVLSFSEAIFEELQGSGVIVTALCPGPTRTDFQNRAGLGESKLFNPKSLLRTDDPLEVAERGFEGMVRGEAIVISGFRNKLLASAVRILPRKLVRKAAKKLHETAYPSISG